MAKHKMSEKEVRARSLAIYELEEFISYIRTIDPELQPDQAIVLTARVLDELPQLLQQNPALLDRIKEVATSMKIKRLANTQYPMPNDRPKN
ncbi:hypothetical protein [Nostoc sp. 'Peltigera malacea cyanobiont' DB3992]|uniref:hypothetical protein n=1 Tax=Nostoc sp. 'Peltigera malacea cyanobiont' DB3992 TaxID=1206980 RepID=UPI000C03CCF5|nr:hypothetical protein [Nostoc sp. 'Peltigera malacea cyanobiont' DB3992]PHM11644.1 hypothetical protein CK516_01510 [Nostoc sp. 'Peltigera malacea cyanobiont' DB3992]